MANIDQSRKRMQEVSTFYEDFGAHFARTRFALWPWMKEVAHHAKPGMTVIDVGAGNGRFSEAFVDGVQYIGIEPSSALREAATAKLRQGSVIKEGSLPHLSIQDAQADITVCIAVLHHLPKTQHEAVFAELFRITKPGGSIYISVWNARGKGFLRYPRAWIAAWLRIPLWKGLSSGECYVPWKSDQQITQRYVYAWTKRELKRLGARYGKVLQCEYINDSTTTVLEGKNILLCVKKPEKEHIL